MSITARLAEFVTQTPSHALPGEVVERAQALLTDFAGSAIRAAGDCDSNAVILGMVERLGMAGNGPCTVFGLQPALGPPQPHC